MLSATLEKLSRGEHLSAAEGEEVLNQIMTGQSSPAQIGAFLMALRMKGETPEEICGFARTMRRHCVRISTAREDVVDTCGTGGDALETFNISTAAAIVAAAAGVPVAKHGNRSVSSACGSADVLTALGVNIDLSPEAVARCIDEIGIGFLFAPNLHPAMKHAIGPRREMGIRTVFNLLGPLTNPAGARRQLLGVFAEDWVRPMAEALQQLGSERAMIVYGRDGIDEISTLGETAVAELADGQVRTYTLTVEDLGVEPASAAELSGGTPEESAELLRAVLAGKTGPRYDIVLANAGAAIYVGGSADSIREGMQQAAEAINSGAALAKLEQLCELSNSL